jgi:hypothetical protein
MDKTMTLPPVSAIIPEDGNKHPRMFKPGSGKLCWGSWYRPSQFLHLAPATPVVLGHPLWDFQKILERGGDSYRVGWYLRVQRNTC